MAEISTYPVFRCRYCQRPLTATRLRTTVPDPDGKILYQVMKGLGSMAICSECKQRYNYLASQNRADEMLLDPNPTLLYVIDPKERLDQ